jgi:anaerobic nitric oxide reductase transcription regulator
VAQQPPGPARIVTLHARHLELAPLANLPAPAAPTQEPPRGLTLREAVDSLQRQMIEDAVARHGGNRTAAARELGLDPANLHRLMKRLGQAPA